jgi:hypothetical protein
LITERQKEKILLKRYQRETIPNKDTDDEKKKESQKQTIKNKR